MLLRSAWDFTPCCYALRRFDLFRLIVAASDVDVSEICARCPLFNFRDDNVTNYH